MILTVSIAMVLGGATPHPGEEEIHNKASEILARPEFSSKGPFNFWIWLGEKLLEWFRSLGALGQTAPLLYWSLLIGCSITLVLLLAHIILTFRKLLWSRAGSADDFDDDELREKRGRLSIAYREEAFHCASRGDFTEAIRYLFLSLVYHFNESGRILFRKNFTNREYLALFQDRPEVYAHLKVFVDTLDDRWYGQRSSEPAQYENCLTLYQSLQ
jgi:hypothetical protein